MERTSFSIRDRLEDCTIALSELEFSQIVQLTLANGLEQRPRVPEKYLFLRQKEFLSSERFLPPIAFAAFKKAYGIA